MLDEGNRRRARGARVVIGHLNTHERTNTKAQIGDLDMVEGWGFNNEEMNLEEILRRNPTLVLVDDIAVRYTDGETNSSRWHQIEMLLEAGVDVTGTIDISGIESLANQLRTSASPHMLDVMPDQLVQTADQIELVDISPEALRRRMAHGNLFEAELVDPDLHQLFSLSNLETRRRLALKWMNQFVSDHGRQPVPNAPTGRVLVLVTGGPSDEELFRRGLKLAESTNSDIVAVYVAPVTHRRNPPHDLHLTRQVAGRMGIALREIVDNDTVSATVAFAQSEGATHVFLSANPSHRSSQGSRIVARLSRELKGSEIHLVPTGVSDIRLVRRRRKSPFTWRRRVEAIAGTALLFPALTILILQLQPTNPLAVVFPAYLATVVAVTAWGGLAVGLTASLIAAILENYFFVEPLHSLSIGHSSDLAALTAYLAFSGVVAFAVTAFATRTAEAERSRNEAEILATAAATVATSRDDLAPILETLRTVFGFGHVELQSLEESDWRTELASGVAHSDSKTHSVFDIDASHRLIVWGGTTDSADQSILRAFLGRLAVGIQSQRIQREEAALQALAATDALRTGLLRAVSHDLRTPLATIEANVSTLLASDVDWSPEEQRAFLSTIEREVHRLTRLVTNLLDAGRLEAGVVTPRSVAVELDDLVASALETIDTLGRHLRIEIPETLPSLVTDPDLYERAVANVVANACRFSPPDKAVAIKAGSDNRSISLLVIDQGPGIKPELMGRLGEPFHRLNDEGSGAGLGLTVAKGFIELLGGSMRFDETPGGGLTVSISTPRKEDS